MTTAILFHQLFEGLSLGIRIASLPPQNIESHDVSVEDEETLLSRLPLPLEPSHYIPPIIPGHDSDSRVPSASTSLPQHSGSSDSGEGTEIQTFRGPSVHWLEPTLSIAFAVTTSFGMGVGMTLWKERGGSDTSLFFYRFTVHHLVC